MYQEEIEKAGILIEALPYIKKFSGKTLVIKYGGSLVEGPQSHASFATDVVLLKYVGINPVIVHGGGKEISRWLRKVGKEPVFIDGLRHTDAETMELTEMVLSGKVNSELVTSINRSGGKAVGLSGKDADLFFGRQIRSRSDADLGFVGDIDEADPTLLQTLSDKGYIPVISSVGCNREGVTLNMNADHVAAGIGAALRAQKLIFLTDVSGLIVEGQLVHTLNLAQAEQLLMHPDIKGGMLPKLQCCINALRGGVKQVHIINGSLSHAVLLEIFTDVGVGTMVES